jgi:hypothetical protein
MRGITNLASLIVLNNWQDFWAAVSLFIKDLNFSRITLIAGYTFIYFTIFRIIELSIKIFFDDISGEGGGLNPESPLITVMVCNVLLI